MKFFAASTITLFATLVSTVSSQASNGCDENYSGTFEINPYNVTDASTIPSQAQTECTTNPIVSLKNGVLTDQQGRTGEVVANHQFQFDNPVQGPTTSGFSVCSNGSLALNGNAIWYGCNSGSFSNLYDISIASYCAQVYIVTFPCVGTGTGPIAGGSSSSSSSSSSSTSTSSTPPPPPATSSTSSTSSSTSTTPLPPPVTTSSTTPVIVPPPATSTTLTSAPFPAGNATTPAASTAPVSSTAPATTSSSSSTTPPTTTPATTFKGAASAVAVGGKVVAVIAGIAAFALV